MTTENIALQAWRKDISYILHAVQGESDSRTFNFILYDQTGAVISLAGKTVAFYVQKPDGNIVMLATTTSGSTISVTLTLQACAVPGVMPCWIQLVDENGDDLRVDSLLLEVQACNFDGAVESSSEFTALQEALGDVAKFSGHITDYNNPHQVNGNQIRTGVIRGEAENGPYFDLDADNGRGELAATSLINTTASPTATIQIVDQTEYYAADFNGGDSTSRIQLQLSKDYTGSFDPYKRCELVTMGDLNIRANSTTTIPMGYNSIELHGNSTTDEGNIAIYRGTQGQQREQVIYAGENNTVLQYKPNSDQNAQIYLSNAEISLNTGGYARASIENDGAHFGDIYQNGNKVVSYDTLPMDDLPQARSNLGMMVLLWSGNWSSGSITVTGIENYNVILCDLNVDGRASNNRLIALRSTSSSFCGIGGSINRTTNNGTWITTSQFDVSGNTLSNMDTWGYTHFFGSNHSSNNEYSISAIYGIC